MIYTNANIRSAINTATQIERGIYVLAGTEESDVEPGFIPGWLPFARMATFL